MLGPGINHNVNLTNTSLETYYVQAYKRTQLHGNVFLTFFLFGLTVSQIVHLYLLFGTQQKFFS